MNSSCCAAGYPGEDGSGNMFTRLVYYKDHDLEQDADGRPSWMKCTAVPTLAHSPLISAIADLAIHDSATMVPAAVRGASVSDAAQQQT